MPSLYVACLTAVVITSWRWHSVGSFWRAYDVVLTSHVAASSPDGTAAALYDVYDVLINRAPLLFVVQESPRRLAARPARCISSSGRAPRLCRPKAAFPRSFSPELTCSTCRQKQALVLFHDHRRPPAERAIRRCRYCTCNNCCHAAYNKRPAA